VLLLVVSEQALSGPAISQCDREGNTDMLVVTGGAGFIGSNLVKALNQRGRTDIVVVDDLSDTRKVKNLSDLEIADYIDKDDFLRRCDELNRMTPIECVFHQGACSDTMVEDGRFVMSINYDYSKALLAFCQQRAIPLIYASSASVYGLHGPFTESADRFKPLNAYAYSKTLFDQYAWQPSLTPASQLVGLRYFNVYGPGEQHKGRMASVAWHLTHQYFETGKVKLFSGTGGYGDGEQRRDFIHVDDAVRANLFFLDHPKKSGVFNVGTGTSRSFNDVALAVINACRDVDGLAALSLDDARSQEVLSYYEMPQTLKGKYQSFTEASVEKLRTEGFDGRFIDVAEGVGSYATLIYQELSSGSALS